MVGQEPRVERAFSDAGGAADDYGVGGWGDGWRGERMLVLDLVLVLGF